MIESCIWLNSPESNGLPFSPLSYTLRPPPAHSRFALPLSALSDCISVSRRLRPLKPSANPEVRCLSRRIPFYGLSSKRAIGAQMGQLRVGPKAQSHSLASLLTANPEPL